MKNGTFGAALVAVAVLGMAGTASAQRFGMEGPRPPRPPLPGLVIDATATSADGASEEARLRLFPALPPRGVEASDETTAEALPEPPPMLGILRIGESVYLLKDSVVTRTELATEGSTEAVDAEGTDEASAPKRMVISAITATLVEAPAERPAPGSNVIESLESAGTLEVSIAKGTKTINGVERTVPVVTGTAVVGDATWTLDGVVLPPPRPRRFDRRARAAAAAEATETTGEQIVDGSDAEATSADAGL